MLRTCPRCGDFYADASLLFCLADGTPLVDVDPNGGSWAEGARVVEEKERVTRGRARRLRLRRVMSMTTALITTAVVLAFAVNSYVYVVTEPGAPVVAAAVTPTPTPARRSETPAWTPTPETPSTQPFVPAVTPTPTPPATPTPRTPTPTPTPTPQQCTADDKQRLESEIVAANGGDWERAVDTEGERAKIARENLPDKAVEASVTLLKPIAHAFTYSKPCAPVSVNVSYTWLVKWGNSPTAKQGEKRVEGAKTFSCRKDGAAWRCG